MAVSLSETHFGTKQNKKKNILTSKSLCSEESLLTFERFLKGSYNGTCTFTRWFVL